MSNWKDKAADEIGERSKKIMRLALKIALSAVLTVVVMVWVSSRDYDEPRSPDESSEAISPSDSIPTAEIEPKPLELPMPVYPEEATLRGIEGEVYVKVFVSAKGDVTKAIILKDSGKNVGFEEAAMRAARKAKWKPAISKDGEPVGVWVAYPIKFTLKY